MDGQEGRWLEHDELEPGSEWRDKALFVDLDLQDMLRDATRGHIAGARYARRESDGEERVVLETALGRHEVCVTCDSLWAIAKDVMRAAGKIYEG